MSEVRCWCCGSADLELVACITRYLPGTPRRTAQAPGARCRKCRAEFSVERPVVAEMSVSAGEEALGEEERDGQDQNQDTR